MNTSLSSDQVIETAEQSSNNDSNAKTKNAHSSTIENASKIDNEDQTSSASGHSKVNQLSELDHLRRLVKMSHKNPATSSTISNSEDLSSLPSLPSTLLPAVAHGNPVTPEIDVDSSPSNSTVNTSSQLPLSNESNLSSLEAKDDHQKKSLSSLLAAKRAKIFARPISQEKDDALSKSSTNSSSPEPAVRSSITTPPTADVIHKSTEIPSSVLGNFIMLFLFFYIFLFTR